MNHRLPKFFYGPLLGFLLGALLTKSSAKTLHISGPHEEDYSDHLFEKPPHEDSHSQWHPVQNPYEYVHPTYLPPPLTTDYPPAPTQVREYHKSSIDYHHSGFAEEVAESSVNVRRQRPRPQGQRRTTRPTRSPAKNRRTTPGKQRRRKTTTTEAYYYDYEERIPPRKKLRRTRPTKRQFNKRRVTTSAYEYDEDDEYDEEVYDEYDYYEVATVPQRKRVNNRKPQNPNRQKVQEEYELDAEYENSENENSNRQVIQRQASSTTPAQETTTETTTTNTTNATSPSPAYGYPVNPGSTGNISFTYGPPPRNNTGYPVFTGYGPSNGNDNISFTYGPPTIARYDYVGPFLDWYSQYATNNAVIKRVQDIVDNDNEFYTSLDKSLK